MSVNATLVKARRGEYKAILQLQNSTGTDITDWYITCSSANGSTITKCKRFTITSSGDIITLTPETKYAVLEADDDLSFDFKGQGDNIPTDFKLVVKTPTPTPTPTPTEDEPSDIMLELVSIAENSSTDWQAQINYIENINDGRGYTISIVGFCTGTGDFIQVLEAIQRISPTHPLVKFVPLVKAVDGTASVKGLEGLPAAMKAVGINDPVFNQAMWEIIKLLYWGPALDYCKRHNLTSNLSRYIAYDTILNFGAWGKLENISGADEVSFLDAFLDMKQKIIEKDSSLGDKKRNRVDMQKAILAARNMNLNRPMTVSCYGDTFTL